jgi:hypothetical protein
MAGLCFLTMDVKLLNYVVETYIAICLLECWYGGGFCLVLPRHACELALCETYLGFLELRYYKWESKDKYV